MNNTNQIRQILQEASLRYFKGEDGVDNLIHQALDILPCKTCNGTGIDHQSTRCTNCSIEMLGDRDCQETCPCPDCT